MSADILHHPAFGGPRVKNRKTRGRPKETISFSAARLERFKADLAVSASTARTRDYRAETLSRLQKFWPSLTDGQVVAFSSVLMAFQLERMKPDDPKGAA
jgi:hypothetical protein